MRCSQPAIGMSGEIQAQTVYFSLEENYELFLSYWSKALSEHNDCAQFILRRKAGNTRSTQVMQTLFQSLQLH
jgi:hypothetical protein